MGSKEVKIEKQFSPADTGAFLKTLADGLAGKPEGDLSPYGIDLQDCKKIKVDIKPEGEIFNLKLKVKHRSPAQGTTADEGSAGPMKYKTLKKQMKSTFKSLKTSLEAGTLPPKETVETFMQQAVMMVSYKDQGYGDEYYDEFMKFCNDLKQAFDAGDMEQLVTAYNCVDARKALCHDKYD